VAHNALGCTDTPNRRGISDTVRTGILTRASGPPLQPASIYPDTIHHHDGTPRVTDEQRIAEQLTAARFGRDRRAPCIPNPGAPLPYARRSVPMPARQ